MLFGNWANKAAADLANNSIRSLANFNWTFIQYSKNTCDFSHGMNCRR